jgi:hypothetical protein
VQGEEDRRMRVKEEDGFTHVADALPVVIRIGDVRRSRSIAGTAAAQEAGGARGSVSNMSHIAVERGVGTTAASQLRVGLC